MRAIYSELERIKGIVEAATLDDKAQVLIYDGVLDEPSIAKLSLGKNAVLVTATQSDARQVSHNPLKHGHRGDANYTHAGSEWHCSTTFALAVITSAGGAKERQANAYSMMEKIAFELYELSNVKNLRFSNQYSAALFSKGFFLMTATWQRDVKHDLPDDPRFVPDEIYVDSDGVQNLEYKHQNRTIVALAYPESDSRANLSPWAGDVRVPDGVQVDAETGAFDITGQSITTRLTLPRRATLLQSMFMQADDITGFNAITLTFSNNPIYVLIGADVLLITHQHGVLVPPASDSRTMREILQAGAYFTLQCESFPDDDARMTFVMRTADNAVRREAVWTIPPPATVPFTTGVSASSGAGKIRYYALARPLVPYTLDALRTLNPADLW